MKTIKLSVPAFAILIFTACSGNSQNQMVSDHQMKEESMKMMKGEMTKKQTIKLKKGELFLVISSITKPDAQNLMNDYFGKVFPIATKNGFKPLSTLPIDEIVTGNYKPNGFVGLYSWPNMSSVKSFLKELPNSELTPMRVKIWDELKQVIASVEKDMEFILYADKVYEVQTIWNDTQIKENLMKYNGKIIFDFPVAGYEDLNNGKIPTQTILIEWESKKDAEKYRMKKKSSNEEESFYTHLQIPEMPAK